MTKTVTAKVPDDLKNEADEYGINVSETIRDALTEAVREQRRRNLLDRVQATHDEHGRPDVELEDFVTTLRRDRERDTPNEGGEV